MATFKLAVDLPGHQDEVFAVRFASPLIPFEWLLLLFND